MNTTANGGHSMSTHPRHSMAGRTGGDLAAYVARLRVPIARSGHLVLKWLDGDDRPYLVIGECAAPVARADLEVLLAAYPVEES